MLFEEVLVWNENGELDDFGGAEWEAGGGEVNRTINCPSCRLLEAAMILYDHRLDRTLRHECPLFKLDDLRAVGGATLRIDH